MFNALRQGNVLKNAVFWKNIQMLITLAVGVSPFLTSIFPALTPLLDVDTLTKLMTGTAALNLYFIPATSDKIGW